MEEEALGAQSCRGLHEVLDNVARRLAMKAGLKRPPRVELMNSPYVWGRVGVLRLLLLNRCSIKVNRAVLDLVEQGLLTVDDLEALIAHELGHCVANTWAKRLGFIALFATLSCIEYFAWTNLGVSLVAASMTAAAAGRVDQALYNALSVAALIAALLTLIPITLFRHWVRSDERMADGEAVKLVGAEKYLGFLQRMLKASRPLEPRGLAKLFKPVLKAYLRYLQAPLEERVRWIEELYLKRVGSEEA
ncbi:MAG: hypothetical protein DRJ69_01460 [Thermoprotei archaeon]|nr:MAG: hypothetical protein DRJ69_01460 [Thermoprotei archaeon]